MLAGETFNDVQWSADSRWLMAEYENDVADRHRLVEFQRGSFPVQVDMAEADASPGRFFNWHIALGVVWLHEVPASGVQEVMLTNFADPATPMVLSAPYVPGVEGAVTFFTVQ